jgi:hypothetical protein
MQTIEAVERLYMADHKKVVLSRNPANKMLNGKDLVGYRNDIIITDIASKPGLISNILQYSSPKGMVELLDNTPLASRGPIFDAWGWRSL